MGRGERIRNVASDAGMLVSVPVKDAAGVLARRGLSLVPCSIAISDLTIVLNHVVQRKTLVRAITSTSARCRMPDLPEPTTGLRRSRGDRCEAFGPARAMFESNFPVQTLECI